MQDILWNNNLVFDKYGLMHYGNIPAYTIMALLIIFSTSVLHQLFFCGGCEERVTQCNQSVLYFYYILSVEKIFEFFKESFKNWGRWKGEYLCIHFDENGSGGCHYVKQLINLMG